MKLSAAILLIFAGVLGPLAAGQDSDKLNLQEDFGHPVPLDQFGEIQCGDLMGRIDYFLQQLTAEEGGIGVVVIRTPKEDIWYALYIESVIYGEIEFHKDDEKVDVSVEDLRFVKIEDPDGSMTTLWVIPPGAESPVSETSNLDLGLPEGTKPFKFRSTFKDREAFYCNTGGEDLQFLEMLEANPLAKGNIVIADKDRKAFREKKKELLSVFSEIDRDRLRFFFVKSNIPYVEYWIVPKRTK